MFINGEFISNESRDMISVINPATETKKEEKTEVNINTSPSP